MEYPGLGANVRVTHRSQPLHLQKEQAEDPALDSESNLALG